MQCTEIVFQQKEKMESSRSNPDVWPCYSVFMCHHTTTTSQTLQITPDISHPPGDLKKFNILNILSKFIQFYCRTKGGLEGLESLIFFDFYPHPSTDQSFCSVGRLGSVKNRIGKMDLFFTFLSESFYSNSHL